MVPLLMLKGAAKTRCTISQMLLFVMEPSLVMRLLCRLSSLVVRTLSFDAARGKGRWCSLRLQRGM